MMTSMRPSSRFGSAIVGTGHYVPERVLTNEDLTRWMDTSDEWITARTGVKERRLAAEEENSGTMSLAASRLALADAGITAADLDLIIVCTVTPEAALPSNACLLQHRLGIAHKGIPAFDLSAACSGFLYGLATAHAHMQTDRLDHVLLVGVDLVSRLTDYTSRSTSILFGDGAGAAVLRRTEGAERGVLYTRLRADGSGHELIHATGPWGTGPGGGAAGFIQMDGPKVYKLAVTRMGEVIEDALRACGLSVAEVDMLIPHQANRRIIDSVAHKLGLGSDRVFINIDRLGNTSAASIPIAYDQCRRAGRIQPNDVVVMAAFGAGLTWGSAVVRA
jgi:3-oxoacyl-[acyl-carrier-protein] synthase III